MVDWLVCNRAASALVVRLVRWISTSSTRAGSGRDQGRPEPLANCSRVISRWCQPGWQSAR
jgi:hypothetical protein